MIKQRRDSADQYQQAGRDELAAQENFEIGVIQEFLPTPSSPKPNWTPWSQTAIAASGSSGQAMGQDGQLKPQCRAAPTSGRSANW